jgi:hypothetical protein
MSLLKPWLFGLIGIVFTTFARGNPPSADEVFNFLELSHAQIRELTEGKAITFSLQSGSADELAVSVVIYIPVPWEKVAKHLPDNDIAIETDVIAYAPLITPTSAEAFAHLIVSTSEADSLLRAKPGDEVNLSAQEIHSIHTLKSAHASIAQHFRTLLSHRVESYRQGGLAAIANYAREETLDSNPSLELRQAANESKLLSQYFPALAKTWLNYPTALPTGAEEQWVWVLKTVENRPNAILRHSILDRWNNGLILLTREFYVTHSYNSSQWINLCLPFHKGTIVIQQVRSFTDRVTGLGGEAKRMIGEEVLKHKMQSAWEYFRDTVVQKP